MNHAEVAALPGARRHGNVAAAPLMAEGALPGPVLVAVRRFSDNRGSFSETWSRRDFAGVGLADDFVQDNQSHSAPAGTLRGLHFQKPPESQAKLVRCLRGRILDVAVDLRRSSASYGRHVAVELSAADGTMLYVPEGFAHGFLTLEPDCEVAYKTSRFYAPDCDAGVAWNDPDLAVPWPIAAAAVVLSDKDARLPPLSALGEVFP
ncbi:dTDP-4-dehydrorhamnose 3,5-epimerase [Roseomonas sp. BN140053]|uniref:dTDP-4-dehydrorhamnose 3,5-epimerase n=1 Tax=Roseomonas sp. BN140053 TaxID=3391898 RepID=UPI0039EB7D27